LTAVRMAFVEGVEKGPKISKTPETAKAEPAAPQASEASPAPSETAPAAEQDESRKKFSKKY